jgi:hypothetical protein
VGEEQERHQNGRDEVGGALKPGVETYSGAIALVIGVEQVDGADQVDDPGQDNAPSPE